MEKQLSKREKVIASCRHYKEVVKKWEVAVEKTEGRKPARDDVKTAPENIQKAYRQYKKLMKYLETHGKSRSTSVSPRRRGQHLGISPKKIFGFGSSDPLVRRNTLLNSFPERRSRAVEHGNPSARFALKISSAIGMLAKTRSPKRKEVDDSFDEEATSSRVPHETVPGSPDSLHDSPKVPSAKKGIGCGISAIWQNLSPNPKSKRRKVMGGSPLRIRKVDSGWLDRVTAEKPKTEGTEAEEPAEDENDSSLMEEPFTHQDSSLLRHDISDEAVDIPEIDVSLKLDEFSFEEDKSPVKPTEPNSRLFAPDFQDFLKSASQSAIAETSLPLQSFSRSAIELNETQSGDSGIGMPSVNSTSSWEFCQSSSFTDTEAVDAVFHNEDACFPPSTSSTLQTIDLNAVTSLFSSNPLDEANASQGSTSTSSRKRTSAMAFSPSPKKPSPKKKFFKSDRSKVRSVRYQAPTFKPPSPLKKRKVTIPPAMTSVPLSSEGETKTEPVPIKAAVVPVPKKVTPSTSRVARSTRAVTKKPAEAGKLDDSNFFDEAAKAPMPRKGKTRMRKTKLTGKSALQSKIDNGRVNENFVRIDITKKVFVRGHKKMSGSKMKREDWKQKKAAASKEEILSKMKCRKCGEAGHFQKFCTKDLNQKDEPDEIDESPFPTLEEAAHMLKGPSNLTATKVNIYHTKDLDQNSPEGNENSTVDDSDSKADDYEDILDKTLPTISPISTLQSYFPLGSTLEEEDALLDQTIREFGHQEFRSGQREAIRRVLKGLSTLVILSTGSGKSLCYQLPAYLYAKKYPGSLAICVSPLVSLMEDQVLGLPGFLNVACIHSNMPSSQKEKAIEKIKSKKLQILLVSPEAVCSGLFGLLRNAADLPLISFACIDEVHCLSQWSHNFRPCYLQLTKILREKLNVTTILGLTATATDATASSVCQHLRIDPSTTIRGEIIPRNLNLSVSRDTIRDEALLSLLRGERFKECDSIIIYCTRREECERLATLIRTCLQGDFSRQVSKVNGRSKVSTACEAYHAGMTAYRRKLVQQQFMSGKIKIVVATVAFGMGIDKSDIRSVIHYNMPKTFESYVQEIGRAGRDGLPAHCHLFLENAKGKDLSELRRHVYSNSVDRPILRKLVRKVFQPCKCARLKQLTSSQQESTTTTNDEDGTKRCPGHEVSFIIADAVEDLDLPQENILTLLCYLELNDKKKWIEMLPNVYQTCKVHSYGGAKLLKSAALKSPPLAAAIALAKEKKRFKDSDSYLEFNVIEVASTLGWNSGIVKRELKNLEWTAVNYDTNGGSTKFRKSGILVEFADLAFHLNAPGDLTDEEADNILDFLHQHNVEQEKSQLYQLNCVFQSLLSVSCPKVDSIADGHDEEKSKMLKRFICEYFAQNNSLAPADWKNDISSDEDRAEDIRRDVVNLLASTRDCVFTGRSVAKIFQGIPSPNFPSTTWGRNRAFWRKYIDVDFNFLCQVAGQEIIRFS